MLHHLFFGQCCIIKLSLLLQIIFNSHAQVLPSAIKHRITFKHPLFFRNIIISKTTRMLKNTIKNSSMNSRQTSHTISKSICLKQFSDITRHFVSLLSICIILIMCRFCNIILFHKFTRLINRNLTLNIPPCCFLQILRCFQPIYRLQTYRHTPSLRTLTLLRFPLPNIFIKIQISIIHNYITLKYRLITIFKSTLITHALAITTPCILSIYSANGFI